MHSEKIIKPLDELVGYINKTPLIIEPHGNIAVNVIRNEITKLNGNILRIFFGNNLEIEIPLANIMDLAKLFSIKRIKFNGDHTYLWANISGETTKFDRYSIKLISLSKSVPVVVHTINGLNEEDQAKINALGGKIKDAPKETNPYSATLPLEKVEELAEFRRITNIRYDQPWQPRSATKTFLPSTFWTI